MAVATSAPDSTVEEPIKVCEQCGDDFDAHALIATQEDPLKGGIILCPTQGCQCYSTFAVPQAGGSRQDVVEPPPATVQALRERLQAGTLHSAHWDDV